GLLDHMEPLCTISCIQKYPVIRSAFHQVKGCRQGISEAVIIRDMGKALRDIGSAYIHLVQAEIIVYVHKPAGRRKLASTCCCLEVGDFNFLKIGKRTSFPVEIVKK